MCVKQIFFRSNWKIFHLAKSFYTTSNSDGCDKYQLWTSVIIKLSTKQKDVCKKIIYNQMDHL